MNVYLEIIETLEDENKRLSEQNEGNAEDLNIAKMEAEANNKAAEDLTVKNEIYEKALEDLKNEKDDIEKDANQVKERMAKLDDEMNTLKAAREDAEIMREHLISIEAS